MVVTAAVEPETKIVTIPFSIFPFSIVSATWWVMSIMSPSPFDFKLIVVVLTGI
jgi:S-adenosylmethionine hydrolase